MRRKTRGKDNEGCPREYNNSSYYVYSSTVNFFNIGNKMSKPIYLSNSGINTYLDCGEKYRLHYLELIRMNYTKSSFTFGSAVDGAVEVMLQNFRGDDYESPMDTFISILTNYDINGKTYTLPKTSYCRYAKSDVQVELLDEKQLAEITEYMEDELEFDMTEYSVADFWKYYDEATKRKADLTKQDFLAFAFIAWNCLISKGRMILPRLQDWVDENVVEVHSTQHEIRIENEHGDILRGYLDFVLTLKNGKKTLIDLKTSGNPKGDYPEGCVETSQQLHIYFQEVDAEEAGYLVAGKKILKKKEPRVTIREVYGKISDEELDKTFDKVEKVLYDIKEEKFEKNLEGCWAYGGCQYREYCKKGSMKGLVKLENKDE
jgi:hypothetical protein